jgi:hypothetical protein
MIPAERSYEAFTTTINNMDKRLMTTGIGVSI